MSTLQANEYVPFEQIKQVSEDGNEYWYARELALVLEYVQWRNFAKVLDRAKIACKNSGYAIDHHFKLNHQRHAEEVRAGVVDEDGKVIKKKSEGEAKKGKKAVQNQKELF